MIINQRNCRSIPRSLKVQIRTWPVLAVVGLLLATATVVSARDAGTTVRVFRLKYILASNAAEAVKPLLSDQGSITEKPHDKKWISVQDRPEIIKQVAERLKIIDRRPSSYVLRVVLLEGVRTELPENLRAEVDPRMKRMYPFKSYRQIGLTTFDGELGTPVEADFGEGYRLSFNAAALGVSDDSPWHIPNPETRMELKSLVLEKIGSSGEKPVEVVRVKVVLSENQESFIAAAGSEDAATGLVLVLKAVKVAGS